jgi:anti-anti-sigma factor
VSLLEIAVETGTSGTVVRLSGESDLASAGQLDGALSAQIASGARHLTIDLSGLRFADSATIGVFIEAHQVLSDAGGTLEIRGPQPAVARTLSLLGVDQLLDIRARAGTGDQPTIP